jgi:hypothetical protein
LSFVSNLVQATLISGTPTEVHWNLVRCITVISDRYFGPDRTLTISVNERAAVKDCKLGHFLEYHKTFNDVENDLIRELHNVERWSMTLSNPAGRTVGCNDVTKYGSFVIFVCFYSGDRISDVALHFNKHLQYLRNASSWNTDARFLVAVLQDHPSCITDVLVRRLLQELWHFKLANVVILAQICDRDKHKVRQSSADRWSMKIPPLEDQKCNRQRNKGFPCPITETDNSKKHDMALSEKRNVTEDYSVLNEVVFGLYTWHPYETVDRCTEVLDIVELDFWSSEKHDGLLYNYPLFPSKISDNLQGCPIFILTAEHPPFLLHPQSVLMKTSKKLLYVEAPVMKLLKTVSSKMNMTQNMTFVERDKVFPELFGKVVKGSFDVVFSPLPLFQFGDSILEQTYALSTLRGKFVVPCGKNFHRWISVVRVFSPIVWLTVIISMIAVCCLMSCFSSCLDRLSQSEYQIYQSFSSCLISIWAVLLCLSASVMPHSDPCRVIYVTWLMFCLAFNTVFQAFVITFLINPGHEHQIENIEELLNSGLPYGFDPQNDRSVNATGDTLLMTILQHRMSCSPYAKCIEWVAYHRNFSTLSTDSVVDFLVATQYVDNQGTPLLCLLRDEYFSCPVVMHMAKGHPLFRSVNTIVGRVMESGLFSKWTRVFYDTLKLNKGVISIRSSVDEYYNLTLEHMQSAFWILCLGLGLGTVAFVAEMCHFPHWSLKRQVNNLMLVLFRLTRIA